MAIPAVSVWKQPGDSFSLAPREISSPTLARLPPLYGTRRLDTPRCEMSKAASETDHVRGQKNPDGLHRAARQKLCNQRKLARLHDYAIVSPPLIENVNRFRMSIQSSVSPLRGIAPTP